MGGLRRAACTSEMLDEGVEADRLGCNVSEGKYRSGFSGGPRDAYRKPARERDTVRLIRFLPEDFLRHFEHFHEELPFRLGSLEILVL